MKLKFERGAEDHFLLMNNGFGDAIYTLLFVTNSPSDFGYWKFLNDHSDFYAKYIKYYPISDEVANIIVSEMNKDNWRSYFLENNLNHLFETIPAKKVEFANKIATLGLNWPSHLNP